MIILQILERPIFFLVTKEKTHKIEEKLVTLINYLLFYKKVKNFLILLKKKIV